MQSKEHIEPLAIALLLSCCAFWGFQQVLVKATLGEIAPVFMASLRFAGAGAVLWVWCLWRGVPLWQRDGSLWPGLLAGSLFATEFLCLFSGLQFTAASRITVFLYTSPLWAALVLPWFIPSERLALRQWLGLLLAFVAVGFTLREGFVGGQTPQQHWGDLLGLGGAIAWALTTVVLRTTRLNRLGPEKLLFYQVGVSALALPVFSLALHETWNWHWSSFAIGSLFLQTVVGAFASYLCWVWLLGRYPATKIGSFALSTPLFALLFGAVWLGEAVTAELVGALAVVGAGITLVNRRKAVA